MSVAAGDRRRHLAGNHGSPLTAIRLAVSCRSQQATDDGTWQEIDEHRLCRPSWQDHDESMISAMTSILVLLVLVAGFGALVRYARHDRFAGPAQRYCHRDDLGCSTSVRLAS